MSGRCQILNAGVALTAMSIVAGCAEDDGPRKIAEAQSACIRLAKTHLSKVVKAGEPVFGEAANVSSDPTVDAFEFRWSVGERTLQWNPPEAGESVKFGGSVGCSGYTEKKIITRLTVAGDTLASALSY